VNFYKRFIGDIQAKTGNLSMSEFGAYDRLLDHYFSTEIPLPADHEECYRICRAMSKDERKAVDKVIARFFIPSENGYIQTKADEVLAEALPKIEAARKNGKLGGRPRKHKTQQKPSGLQNDNPNVTQQITHEAENEKASQSQSQTLSKERGRATRLPADWKLPPELAEWAKTARPDLNPEAVADKFRDYWHGKAGKDGAKLDWAATWRNWVREERAPFKSQPAETLAWYETKPGVERKAVSLGLGRHIESEEQYPVYRARIMTAAREKQPSTGLNIDQLAALANGRMESRA
jgi:uncharacterized protein YdaU (DUF1376 family)